MRKIHSIQYLRGIAATMVVLAHAIGQPIKVENAYLTMLGRCGVILFFVISGFIITTVTGTDSFDPRVFLKKRFVRVVPFYWLVTLLAGAGAFAAPFLYKRTVFDVLHLVKSLTFIPYYDYNTGRDHPSIQPIVKLGWTLDYEIFFYLAFGLLFFLNANRRALALGIGFAALYVLGLIFPTGNAIWTFYSDYFILFFCVGVFIGVGFLNGWLERMPPWGAAALAAAAAALAVLLATAGPVLVPTLRNALIMLMCASIATGCLWIEARGIWRTSPALERLGDASYSIYLVHMFWVGGATVAGARLFGSVATPGSPAYLATVAVAFVGGVGFGLVAYRLVEKPLVEVVRRRLDVRRSNAVLGEAPPA